MQCKVEGKELSLPSNGILEEESSSSSLLSTVAQPRNRHNCTNPTSSLKHQERLECRALPWWARRRELHRCFKLPLASRHTNIWHVPVLTDEWTALPGQNKGWVQKKPCLKEPACATEFIAPFPGNCTALSDSTHLFWALPSTPSKGYTILPGGSPLNCFPAMVLTGKHTNHPVHLHGWVVQDCQ